VIYKIPILFFLAAAVLFFSSCSDDKFEPPRSNLTSSDSLPSQESFNTSVNFSDSGTVKAILEAGWIGVYTKLNYTLIDSNAKVEFFKDGEYNSTLTAKRGKIYDNTKDVEVYDSVKLVSTDGSELTTEKLYWTNKTRRVKTDAFVTINTPKEKIQGYGFEADENLKNYTIYKVSGIITK
jgi:LPS export ABC transporter protein LptC